MNSRPQLLYLAFGTKTYQLEAIFSIATAFARAGSASEHEFDVQVFTDSPALYAQLPVQLHSINPAWSGPHNYHFRLKHEALRQALGDCEQAILIDTDTFFHASPMALFKRVKQGHLLCNAIGKALEHAPQTAFLNELYARNLADRSLRQTNSGVIGLVQQDIGTLDRSIALMDELYETAGGTYTLEELCLALAAHRQLELNECTDLIHHYWSRKAQFRAKITAWYNKHQQHLLSNEALADALSINDRLPRPAQPYRGLQKLISLLVPSAQRQFVREALYGCYRYSNEFDQACSSVWWEKALSNAEERLKRPLSARELQAWLANKPLRLMAGHYYPALCDHLSKHLQSR